ncbi:MAG: iron-containing alcohol dehydrogenase [Clostridiales bacterium]|nr:iron-containing alcohol dehydrogenase [Clostridiales bacterium]
MKKFGIKTTVYFGEDALARLTEIEAKNVLVIADPFIVKSGMIDLITARLKQAQIPFNVFADVVPDPPVDKVVLGVKSVLDSRPDCLVAVGGGSAIDSAKAIRSFAGTLEEGYYPRLIAIPTTSGTGSEVTMFSVISDVANERKIPLLSPDLAAEEAILDEVLVKSVPPAVTADTGMDVFTHALESYVSLDNNEFSAAFAEKAIEIIGMFLLRSYHDNNDTHARRKMHVASCLAGLAFNSANLGLNHAMAHQLGANFHIAHGRANAILLPHVISFNADINRYSKSKAEYLPSVRKYCTVARTLGVQAFNEVNTVNSLVGWVEFMLKEMNIPLRISEMLDITKEEYERRIPSMAKKAMEDACMETTPRKPTQEQIEKIYRNLW